MVLGTGGIDFADILKQGSQKGLAYYIVEQEAYEGTTPLDAAQADASYMKSVKVWLEHRQTFTFNIQETCSPPGWISPKGIP